MTEQHPITPPDELLDQWASEFWDTPVKVPDRGYGHYTATQTAKWCHEQRGAVNEKELQKARDEELNACEEWLREARNHGFGYDHGKILSDKLRAARRPKPKTQEEEALEALDHLNEAAQSQMDTTEAVDIIRRALERLREHEQQVEAQVND